MKIKKIFTKDLFEKLYFIILCLNVLILNIFVGSTHKDPRTLIETIIIFETLIFIVISKIYKKEKVLIKGKIDIAVALLMISTFLPLLFKTYCSLSWTIDICIMYLTVYSMYILTRNLVTSPKRKNIFLNVILLSSCVIIIFGIDRINFNIFQKFYNITRSSQVKDSRMTSIIGYWNATFAYIVSLMILALGKYLNTENKKVSGLYAVYVELAMYAFYFCNSRAGMIIFAIVFVAYLIKLKNLNIALQAILLVIFTYSLTIVFDKITIMYHTKLSIAIGVILTLIVTYIISYLIKKINSLKIHTSRKSVIITIIVLLFIIIAYVSIAKNYSTPVELNSSKNSIALQDLKNNKKYKLKIVLTQKNGEQLTIKVLQVDTKRNEDIIYEQTYTAKDGKIIAEFEIEVNQENMDKIQINFESEDNNSEWIFNKIYVDGKENIINYKYLPNSVMRLFKTLHFNNVSITERLSMYRSGFKLFLEHPIVGNGAKTFLNEYRKVSEYTYSTKEVHSYYMDILIDYGIIGITACIIVIVITIYNFIKKSNTKDIINISIFASWIFVAIHTIFDFDLAYMLTLSNFYVMIALINTEDKNLKIKSNIPDYIAIIIMTICVVTNIYKLPGEKLYRDGKYKEAIKYIPYNTQNMNAYIESSEDNFGPNQIYKKDILIRYLKNERDAYQYWNIISLYDISMNLIRNDNVDEGITGLDTILNLIEADKIIAKYDIINNKVWSEFVSSMKSDANKLNENYSNEKIKDICERIKRIN